MEARYLYINGEYVHTKAELFNKIQKLIKNEPDKDATIKLLSDLYRNGHLRTFCNDVAFELESWRGDTEIANHILSKLSGESETPVFDLALHTRVTFDGIEIRRNGEMTIKIIKSQKNDNASELTYLMNGFRRHTNKHEIATVDIKYTVLKQINEKIPIYVGSSKAELILSSAGSKNTQVEILESMLDPQKDLLILIGAQGKYGKICLKAPQITIPITYIGKKVLYPMMRIIKYGYEVFYIGIWPFEYNNQREVRTNGDLRLPGWGSLMKADNYLLQSWFQKAEINFLLYPREYYDADNFNSTWNFLYERFMKFVMKPIQMNDARLNLPTEEEWEYAACMKVDNESAMVENIKGTPVYADENKSIVLSSKNLKRVIRPNSHGIYAMLGNVYELAVESYWPYFMGGDISNRYNCKTLFLQIEKVPFWGVRLVIRDNDE